MRRIRNIAPLAAALAALALAVPAAADYHKVIDDCSQDGQLNHHYSHDDLKNARDHLPTDITEYTDCKTLIERALASGGGGSSTNGGLPTGAGGVKTASGTPAGSSADVSALTRATRRALGAKPSVTAGGQTITPAASGLNHVPGAANELPVALLVAIAIVAALCTAGGVAAAWHRWPALVRAPLRLVRR